MTVDIWSFICLVGWLVFFVLDYPEFKIELTVFSSYAFLQPVDCVSIKIIIVIMIMVIIYCLQPSLPHVFSCG